MDKPIAFSPHAEEQFRERTLSGELVLEVIQEHRVGNQLPGRYVAQRLLQAHNKQYLLRVVYDEETDLVVVVTAYLTSRVAKYGSEQ